MAATTHTVLSPYFVYNDVVLTAQVSEIRLPFSRDELDGTQSGDTTRSKIPGLENWTLTAVLYRTEGATSVASSLWAAKEAELAAGGTPCTWSFRYTNTTQGATNPTYAGSAYISSMNVVAGAVGAPDMVEVNFMAAAELTRTAT
jgi:hypothetical protein